MRLREVRLEDKEQIWKYREEFLQESDHVAGAAYLDQAKTFEEWFEVLQKSKLEETVPDGWVPAVTYVAVDAEENILGIINFRIRLNEFLLHRGGHIGYSVRKSERRKGYAKEMVRLCLLEAKERGIDRVLITCNAENIASENTIKANGGKLENIVMDDGEKVKRFWIEL